MSSTTPVSTGSVKSLDDLLATGGSVQLKFAALQLKLAQTNKAKAMEYMDTMTENQKKAKECADWIAKARAKQTDAGDSYTLMDEDMKKYFTDNGLKWESCGDDDKHDKDEWDFNIKSLTNYQETLNTGTQQQMVFLQDFMGQYNSYLTGANSAIQQANQTLLSIARGQ
jgi:hypothetical protein